MSIVLLRSSQLYAGTQARVRGRMPPGQIRLQITLGHFLYAFVRVGISPNVADDVILQNAVMHRTVTGFAYKTKGQQISLIPRD